MLLLALACVAQPPAPVDSALAPAGETGVDLETRCDDPSRRTVEPWTREELGADWPTAPVGPDGFRHGGQGVVVADLDGDGWHDLFVPRLDFPSQVLQGGPDGFRPAPEWLPVEVTRAIGASAADADGDGDLDVAVYALDAPPLLLRNTGAELLPEPIEVPDRGPVGCGASASWGDYDLDGDLDLFLGRADRIGPTGRDACESWLMENVGGTFRVVEGALSDDVHRDRVLAAGWLPLDDDPWPELYVVSDLPGATPGNRVLDNDGGVLSQHDDHSLEVRIAGMGLATADLDDDGRIDLFVPGIDEYALFLSSPTGPWIESSFAQNLRPEGAAAQHTAWAGAFEDLDNDGLEDMVVAFGPTAEEGPIVLQQPDAVHRQVAPGRFEQVGPDWGLDDDRSVRSIVVADLDGDGFLDLVRRELGAGVRIDRGRCDDSAWLVVRLHQPDDNPHAVGATVVITAGGERWMRLLTAGGTGYASSGPPELHFGLGHRDEVDDVVVTWPDGSITSHGPVGTRRVLDVQHDER